METNKGQEPPEELPVFDIEFRVNVYGVARVAAPSLKRAEQFIAYMANREALVAKCIDFALWSFDEDSVMEAYSSTLEEDDEPHYIVDEDEDDADL